MELWLTSRACRVRATLNGCVNEFIPLMLKLWPTNFYFSSVLTSLSLFHRLQGLLLSLTTRLAFALVAESESARSPSAASAASSQSIIGSLHRSAQLKASPEKEAALTQSPRGQRCVRCGTSGYYGGAAGGGYGGYGGYGGAPGGGYNVAAGGGYADR
jgi:hypothetical protein